MLDSHQIEDLISLISSLGREALTHQFRSYRASFPIDFTDDFLVQLDLDRMRHIFLAVCLRCQRFPEVLAPAA